MMMSGEVAPAVSTIDRCVDARVPMSFGQSRLWLLAQMYPASHAYNLRTAYRLRGALDLPALQRSLTAIVERHEALRTNFESSAGEPVARLYSDGAISIPLVDLSPTPLGEREAELQRRASEFGHHPFDLSRGPLLRAVVFRFEPHEHVLLIAMHHVAFDDGSIPTFNRELRALYAAFHRGLPADLSEPVIQYADFAGWQRDAVAAGEFSAQLAYWRDALAGAPARIELPLDRPRPAISQFHGAVRCVTLDAQLSERVRALGRSESATLFMTLLAAFKVLLYRYTGQRDLVIGSPIAGRTHVELESLIGFVVNTVALRTRLDATRSFRYLLRAVRETAISAYDNGDMPFEQIVSELQPGRSLAGTPFFNVMFFVRSDLGERLELDGLHVEPLQLTSASARFDLSLRITDRPDGLRCSLQYDTDIFDEATIDRLLAHYTAIVEAIVQRPDEPIRALPMLSANERRQMLVEWNATAAAYDGERTLAELFEGQVGRTPNAIAVAADGAQLSYAELNARSNRVAHALRRAGLTPGDAVGVCIGRHVAMVVATLAVVKAGGVYVPLDADYPAERLRYMVHDAGVLFVLTREGCLAALADEPDLTFIGVDAAATANGDDENLPRVRSSDDLVYVMYTSGSSGRPKGVCISGRAVNRLVIGTNYVEITSADVIAQVASYSFDVVTFELWGALLHGARLEIITRDVLLSPALLATALARRDITIMFVTGALFRYVAATQPAAFAGLRVLGVTGEKVDPAAARAVLMAAPPQRLVNAYGPTETTTFATTYDITLPVRSPIPIGRPIANTTTYILDADLNAVPPGVAGQLFIGGPGLATGYRNNPEATARAFIAHPFGAPEERLYATGDVARYLPDGTIDFLGRIDRQVKIRGFRIEVNEIERALSAIDGVSGAVVDVRTNDFGDRYLVAYVVDATQPERSMHAWRTLLGRVLPDYMLPGAIVNVPSFPMTLNGKIDIDALPDPRGRVNASEPASDDERHHELAALWSELLHADHIESHANFFDLGGDSLLATRMISSVGQRFGHVSLASFLTNPTIEQLAALLDATDRGATEAPIVELRGTGSRPPFFFFHGDFHGDGTYAHQLARYLGPDQPFYSLPPRTMRDGEKPATIEEMAHDAAALIRSTRPDGPYLLGGYCAGGLVAYEIARELRANGGPTVANVILIDSAGAHGRFAALRGHVDALLARLGVDRQRRHAWYDRIFWRLNTLGHLIRIAARSAPDVPAVLILVRALAMKFNVRPKAAPPTEFDRLQRLWDRIAGIYVPRPYDGRVTVLIPDSDWPHRSAEIAGWRAVAKAVTIERVAGEHYTCITDHLATTAAHMHAHVAG